jgi:hypothetical protein
MKFITALFKDMIDQAWTLVALIIGYIVLEGTARELTGWLIIGTLCVWIVTFPLRYDKEQ